MGVEVDTLFYGAPLAPEDAMQVPDYESHQRWLLEQQTVRGKTKSLGGPKKRMMPATQLRKSYSDRPLSACASVPALNMLISTSSASMESGLYDTDADDNQLTESDHATHSGRRKFIMECADEIIRGKAQVGMQLGETCPVCLLDDVDTTLTNCGHRVHAKCIKRWIQNGSKCPVCREVVTGVQEAFDGPHSALYHPLEKDLTDFTSEDASTSTDNQANEWGWFEEFDDFDDTMDEDELVKHLHSRRRHSLQGQMLGVDHSVLSSRAPLMNREMSTTFEVCRTFSPLRLEYDTPYSESKHEFMRGLSSHRHIAAKIQIRSFRIVESANKTQYAEYLIELQLDRKYFSRWRRFSELSRVVGTLATNQFRRTLASWAELEASSRWFNRLELTYLHKRCRMLEQFSHALLQESSSAHPLADLLDG